MRSRLVVILGLALAGTQAGHLLTYQVRFGPAAQQLQSSGAHGYFPALLKSTLGAAALALLASLAVVGFARFVAGRSLARRLHSPSYLSLLAILFTLQLSEFMAQEAVESLVYGVRVASGAELLLWGILGQLPVAAVTAGALRWLWSRVEAAVEELAAVPLVVRAGVAPQLAVLVAVAADELALLLAHAAHAPFVKRGPPNPPH